MVKGSTKIRGPLKRSNTRIEETVQSSNQTFSPIQKNIRPNNFNNYMPVVENKQYYEKDDTNNSIKSDEDPNRPIMKKRKEKSVNNITRFLDKMYEPFVAKKSYLRTINDNLGKIKKHTQLSISENFKLRLRKNEFKKMTNELVLYNNPKINLDSLSLNTYNSVVRNIIDTQIDIDKKRSKNGKIINKIRTITFK